MLLILRSHRAPEDAGQVVAVPKSVTSDELQRLRLLGEAPPGSASAGRGFRAPSSDVAFAEAGVLLTLLDSIALAGVGPIGHRIVGSKPEGELASGALRTRAARSLRLQGGLNVGALGLPSLPPSPGRSTEFRPWLDRMPSGDVVLRFVVLQAGRVPRYEAHQLLFPGGGLVDARRTSETVAAHRPSAAR